MIEFAPSAAGENNHEWGTERSWPVQNWAPGTYSIARFDLIEQGPSTRLVLDHTGFPAGNAAHLAAGWYANYWEPLRKVLG